MSGNGNRNGLADPSRLKPIDGDEEGTVKVIIETPKGSRNKYAFDPDERTFTLKKVLPAGMAFPYDFGFVPSTEAEDGDPVDVLVLMDEPAFSGCVLKCRLIGVIEGEQGKGKKQKRNNRHINDSEKKFVNELEEFFVNYHDLTGKEYRILDVKGPGAAHRCVEQ